MTTAAGRRWYRDVYLKSPRWRVLRFVRNALDRRRCQRCGNRPGRCKKTGEKIWLETHHKSYRWTVAGWSYMLDELGDLETLCNLCHDKEYNGRR